MPAYYAFIPIFSQYILGRLRPNFYIFDCSVGRFRPSMSASPPQPETCQPVCCTTIDEHGAVSGETVLEMTDGIFARIDADVALSISGIAGPDGGSEEKPVGTVWIAVISKHNIKLERYTFAHNRERNILRSSQAAINLLRQLILTEQPNLA